MNWELKQKKRGQQLKYKNFEAQKSNLTIWIGIPNTTSALNQPLVNQVLGKNILIGHVHKGLQMCNECNK